MCNNVFSAMVRMRGKEKLITRYSFFLSQLHRPIASSPSYHHIIALSCHRTTAIALTLRRFIVIAPTPNSHRAAVIKLLRHRSIVLNLYGAIVYYVTLSGFHTVCTPSKFPLHLYDSIGGSKNFEFFVLYKDMPVFHFVLII